ncbi:MAG: hypothetical protein EP338_13945 [Bacteroidetes bacterium]|nr:MAG: hypothetical protein EP338_13945 [Bacteroidota bacterium]
MKSRIIRKWALAGILLSLCVHAKGQEAGFRLGLMASLGTHLTNVGWKLNLYYTDYFYQLNVDLSTKWNAYAYGGRRLFAEHRLATGMVLLAGKKELEPDFHLDALNHQTPYNYAVSYNYLWYFDGKGTSQRSGGWGLHLKNFSVLLENDVFGGEARDRFRTGMLEFAYRYGQNKLFTNFYIWTGETRGSVWEHEVRSGCPNGYRKLDHLPYGKTSHGIWSFGWHGLYRNQFLTAKAGWDSESVRHFMQNRLSHDLILLPRKMKRNTPHYPRLNAEGMPVFSRKEQRPSRIYLQASMNELWSN